MWVLTRQGSLVNLEKYDELCVEEMPTAVVLEVWANTEAYNRRTVLGEYPNKEEAHNVLMWLSNAMRVGNKLYEMPKRGEYSDD